MSKKSGLTMFFLLFLFIIIMIVGCNGFFPSPEPTIYTITAIAGENGKITSEGKITLMEGEEQSFTITPDKGYKVLDVLIDGESVGAVTEYTFTDVRKDHTIQVSFQKKPQSIPPINVKTYTITSTATEGGTINPSGKITVTEGGEQTFSITPDNGYIISDVIVDDVSVGKVNEYAFTDIQANHTIEAFFIQQFTITANTGDNGSIEPEGEITVLQGENQTFTITSDICYQIETITLNGEEVETKTPYTIDSIQQDYSIEVSFILSDAKIRRYNQSGELQSKNYTSIQNAIDTAEDGDTIIVCPGTYYENLVIDGKNITVKSADPSNPDIVAATIVDGDIDEDGTGDGSVVTFTNGDTSTLEGFTIINGTGTLMDSYTAGGGIYVNNSNPNLLYNIIDQNHATIGGGIYIINSSSTVINGNNIYYNQADNKAGGIYIHESSPNIIYNTINNNSAGNGNTQDEHGGGIYIFRGYSESFNGINNNKINNNEATYDGGGIYLYEAAPEINNNCISKNSANRNGGGMFIKNNPSPNITNNNAITDNMAGQHGGGIYMENSYNTGEKSIIGNSIESNTASSAGGGIYMNNSSPTISDNHNISENEAKWGGGIYMYNSSSLMTNNIITANNAITISAGGGGIYMSSSSPLVSDNTISNNVSENNGGGILIESSYSEETDHAIAGNIIENNMAIHGGGFYINNSNPKITNNLSINGNSALHGGAMMIQGDNSIEMSNNNIKNNQAEGFGGGMNVSSNTILLPISLRPKGWGDLGDEDYREDIPVEEGDNGDLIPPEDDEYEISGNVFQGNKHGEPLDYSEGAHVYFKP